MISQLNSANIRSAYANSFTEDKEVLQKGALNVSKQGDTTKVEQIKEAIASGQYKINLQTLSEKIAQELL
ncbi:MAG TPA: flagellar biosynthesis anti-sigma factor FlgM [Sulfurimonas sp.]|uniref:flagellar biosynthesis anti-sigma factor FlgM n=1 Tax=Sulfurimonas sp. TaxID=2022749 RepID=UPI002CCD9B2C|nr:flagellar biosynthesis anti-sigma factor FlgM [Sulfurimonas sp.]HUH42615.1 flagellar biosynthesis anti-sigma factor FlgM [Sulfurimonas sp.]